MTFWTGGQQRYNLFKKKNPKQFCRRSRHPEKKTKLFFLVKLPTYIIKSRTGDAWIILGHQRRVSTDFVKEALPHKLLKESESAPVEIPRLSTGSWPPWSSTVLRDKEGWSPHGLGKKRQ